MSQSSPATGGMGVQREGNDMENRLRIREDQGYPSISLYQKIKDSSELLISEKGYRESRPDEEVPLANAT